MIRVPKLPGVLLGVFLVVAMIDASACGADGKAGLRPAHLRCEYLADPLAVDVAHPRLSWRLEAKDPQARGLRQKAYQILVGSDPARLAPGQADLWDSGRVASDRSLHIRCTGKTLASRQACYWKVRVWDQDGRVSQWSETARWRMGLLEPEAWGEASWISLGRDGREGPHCRRDFQTQKMERPDRREAFASPLLRHEFVVTKPVKTALAYVCGLGYHELYLNGERLGDHVLDPGQTSYDVRAFYVTHDVTDSLRRGDNAIGIWLGNGFYGQNIAFTPALAYGRPCGLAQLWIEYTDGSTATVVTDGKWKAANSPVVFDNVYAGETFDARLLQRAWSEPGFDDGNWQAVQVVQPAVGKLQSQLMPPIRKIRTVRPARILDAGAGRWIVDLGQNIAGWLRLSVRQRRGAEIKITYAEHLMPDGKSLNTASTGDFATGVIQQDVYICRGDGEEVWEPRFTYHGFRYAEISGLTREPALSSVQGVLVHSDVPRRGTFACSDPLLNRMYDVSLWTIVDNLHSIPEDCPHRERCGWTGDAHIAAEAEIYNLDMARFLTKYAYDIQSVLGRGKFTYKGRQPTAAMVPCSIAPGKRLCLEATTDWGVAVVLVPWYLHLYYGDTDVLDAFCPHIKAFLEYKWTFVADGVNTSGLGDWCPPRWRGPRFDDPMECHPDVSATTHYYAALQVAQAVAAKKGDDAFAQWCSDRRLQMQGGFSDRYLKPTADGALTLGSQTGMALALRYGLVPRHLRLAVARGLVHDIEMLHDGHHSCGMQGLKHLFTVLCDYGYDRLAYRTLTIPTFPSHAYVLSRGMTTWPERQLDWPQDEPFDDRSYNHPMHSGFAAFFHEAVGGIMPDAAAPGFKHIVLKPHLLGQLEWARTQHECLYGHINSHWRINDGRFEWTVEIPCNTTATVHIPAPSPEGVRESGQPLDKADNVEYEGYADGRVRARIGSGRYKFESRRFGE